MHTNHRQSPIQPSAASASASAISLNTPSAHLKNRQASNHRPCITLQPAGPSSHHPPRQKAIRIQSYFSPGSHFPLAPSPQSRPSFPSHGHVRVVLSHLRITARNIPAECDCDSTVQSSRKVTKEV
ncbi:hypothetical protein LIA77_00447 [Sarocladium implicatum]|nr:hypothetical protein LIA77_00447 [Sarocladium implicatum]